jgi:hypothetical protein
MFFDQSAQQFAAEQSPYKNVSNKQGRYLKPMERGRIQRMSVCVILTLHDHHQPHLTSPFRTARRLEQSRSPKHQNLVSPFCAPIVRQAELPYQQVDFAPPPMVPLESSSR